MLGFRKYLATVDYQFPENVEVELTPENQGRAVAGHGGSVAGGQDPNFVGPAW